MKTRENKRGELFLKYKWSMRQWKKKKKNHLNVWFDLG
jgi:hypothetical protein